MENLIDDDKFYLTDIQCLELSSKLNEHNTTIVNLNNTYTELIFAKDNGKFNFKPLKQKKHAPILSSISKCDFKIKIEQDNILVHTSGHSKDNSGQDIYGDIWEDKKGKHVIFLEEFSLEEHLERILKGIECAKNINNIWIEIISDLLKELDEHKCADRKALYRILYDHDPKMWKHVDIRRNDSKIIYQFDEIVAAISRTRGIENIETHYQISKIGNTYNILACKYPGVSKRNIMNIINPDTIKLIKKLGHERLEHIDYYYQKGEHCINLVKSSKVLKPMSKKEQDEFDDKVNTFQSSVSSYKMKMLCLEYFEALIKRLSN